MSPQFLNQNNTTVFRSSGEGLLYYSFKDKIFTLDIVQGNLFKIREKDFNGRLISQVPEFQFYEVRTQDGIRTFTFAPAPTKLIAGSGGGLSQSSVINLINGSIIPLQYQLQEFILPTYDLDLRFMGDKLLELSLNAVTINSIALPTNNVLSKILMSAITLNENLNLDVSAYGNLQTLSISQFVGINILNIESSPSLKFLDLSGTIQNIAGSTFAIGSLNGDVALIQISIASVTKLTSISNIQNLPNLIDIAINSNPILATIGNLDGNASMIGLSIQNNSVLTSVGSMAGLTSLPQLIIINNPILTTIGSLLGQTSAVQYNLDTNNFNGAMLSQILIDIDANGALGGFLVINNQATGAGIASLTGAGVTAYANLLGKGWTIIIDP